MTAPSAAQLPYSARPLARPSARGPRSRSARRLAGLATALLLASAATGCVTVHGATALVPSATRAGAAKALAHWVKVSNEAQTRLDPQLNSQVESGALGALDGATLKEAHAADPGGNPGYRALTLSHTKILIPRQRGWAKWFVVDTVPNGGSDHWLLVFSHDSAAQPWRATYLALYTPAQAPAFATDGQGYAVAVPAAGSRLAVDPGALSARYAAYLQHGDQGPAAFAAGQYTSDERAGRRKPTAGVAVQFADEAADPAHYPVAALRLKDGGALVFFTSQFQVKETVAKGPISVSGGTKALLTGTPNTSLTLFEISEQAVTVPATGKVVFLDQVKDVVDVHGQ